MLRRLMKRALLPVLATLAVTGAGLAFSMSVQKDRPDNAFTFVYDADRERLVTSASSHRMKFDDKVDFLTHVSEDASTGDALEGGVTLQLLDGKRRVYEGTFSFLVRDESGETAFRQTKHTRIALTRNSKKKTLTFPFDVPSGSYSVSARFSQG